MDAYEKIKIDILKGVHRPGERLAEQNIAQKLNISRTPVREAIRRLSTEGLVVYLPNRGATVRKYSVYDIRNAYNLRALIEGYAASLAAQNRLNLDVESFREASNEYENMIISNENPKNENRIIKLIASNRRFHDLIIEGSQNQYIASVVSNLISLPLIFQSFYWFDSKEMTASIEIHNRIADSILEGDAEQAKALMMTHILTGRDYVLKQFNESSN